MNGFAEDGADQAASGPLPGWLRPLADAVADRAGAERAAVEANRPDRRSTGAGRAAAVLVAIGSDVHGPELILIERAATLRSHPGQVAFPGGSRDPGDDFPAGTAVREATEEVGLDPASVRVFGTLPANYVAVSGFDVTPVLAWWHTPGLVRVVDRAEVAAVHRVPVAWLTDPARRGRVRHPSGYVGPAFEIGPADRPAEPLVWGLTAHMVDAVLDLAGWTRPWDRDRMLPIPDRHLSDGRAAAARGTGTVSAAPPREERR
ncbi:8-oxo-dGTP pyrophosphatase MutT (NUDIX family) [Friedmanniella endophytica]|uniref:8-oxo-dGTP pyrophosphatase MutT (NUDIX family) n=1 Tax=Microlunatus kandeliicorticis TaxID=1759536 RepID=A0A7W3IRM9_9ACTN|nr:CoA pyrophosphatase [Microlunatus kandeliicorticis]MBA8793987.1 8-oxo-dGTP pyrophosphatase MutT (NUDIX family) [Microlunatus kandeliicorticis]